MALDEAAPREAIRQEDKGPPCKRCASRNWSVERHAKSRLRWLAETVIAAPEVWIFQGESGGWPDRRFELWTCRGCGRRARV